MARALRLTALVVTSVVVQATVLPHLRLLGVVPDLGLVVAVAVAYVDGPDEGAIVGFCAGLGYDLFLQTPLGLSALAYALTAYLVGLVRGGMLRPPRFHAVLLGGLGGLVGGLLFASAGVIFGVDVLRGWDVLTVVARAALYDALIAIVVFPVVERLLRGLEPVGATGW